MNYHTHDERYYTEEEIENFITKSISKYVAGEPSLGTLHPSFRNGSPTSWDIVAKTNSTGSPYTWNISSLVPVGTKGVKIEMFLYRASPWVSAGEGVIWDYDIGAYNAAKTRTWGVLCMAPSIDVRSSSYPYGVVDNEGTVWLTGSSRKLYIAKIYGDYYVYAQLKGYWI